MKKTIFVVGILTLAIALLNGCRITGNVPLDTNCKCQLTTKQAQFESKVVDDEGTGCLTDCQTEIWVKNKENQPNRIKIAADCTTVDGIKQISSDEYWIQPGGEYTFSIKVPVGMLENWKCSNFKISSDIIYGCEKA